MSARTISSGSTGSPASASSAPGRQPRGDRREDVAAVERRADRLQPVLGARHVDHLGDPAEALRGERQQAVVRPDEDAVLLGRAQRDRAPRRPHARVDHGQVHARRAERQRAPQDHRGRADVVALQAVRQVDHPRVGRDPRDHRVADPDEVVFEAVVGQERDRARHRRVRLSARDTG
jgi:hypothetical protein